MSNKIILADSQVKSKKNYKFSTFLFPCSGPELTVVGKPQQKESSLGFFVNEILFGASIIIDVCTL
jgi:hypothetical protein